MNKLNELVTVPAERHWVTLYFALTYTVSWSGALLVALPYLLQHRPLTKNSGLLMFPVMLLGPSLVGLALIGMTGRAAGFKDLTRRMGRVKVSAKWYASLLLLPTLIVGVLMALKTFVSSAYDPNHFFIGFSFGIAAGLLEEVGWTGFVLPKMLVKRSTIGAGLLLGVLWGVWHLPVIDFLGAAFPHQHYLLPFMAAFIAAMTAIRILMVWIYRHTQSLILAQLMHAISTGSLVALGPAGVTPAQEAIWYGSYAAALWVVVAIGCLIQRRSDYLLGRLGDSRSRSAKQEKHGKSDIESQNRV